jgi:hypothetical protein
MLVLTSETDTATQFDIKVNQGRTFRLKVNVQNADGTVRTLTGYQSKMQIKPSADSATILQTLTEQTDPEVTGIITNGAGGFFSITIANEQTSTYTWDSAVYDLQIDNGLDPEVLLRGGVQVIERVTS